MCQDRSEKPPSLGFGGFFLACALEHSEEIAGVIGVCEHIEALEKLCSLDVLAHVAQGGKILDREADAVKQGDLRLACATLGLTGDHLPKLCDGVIGGELLNFALDAGLRGKFHKDIRAMQDRFGQFGFAGAVASDGVDMHARADHIVGEDCRALFVGGAGGDDLCAFHTLFGGAALG